MASFGIYTLANDVVYDQLIALLNSIEVNVSPEIQICVIPYDNRLDRVKKEIDSRDNVKLFENIESLQRWDSFVNRVWEAHPQAKKSKFSRPSWYRGFVHRKFAAFDGEFDRFIFYDADSLAMKPIDDVFAKLEDYDLIFNDWEHNKKGMSTEINVEKIATKLGFAEIEIRSQLHCDSFFSSKKGLFNSDLLEKLQKQLIEQKEIEWVRERCWWSSSALFSYLTFRAKYSQYNFTLSPNSQDRTGNCADADPFVNIDNILYNEEGLKPIHRLHYMNYSSADFARLCRGENVDIRYKDVFLHYRFLKQPEQQPQQFNKPNLLVKNSRVFYKAIGKLKRVIA